MIIICHTNNIQGRNDECTDGQWCFIDIDCPITIIQEPVVEVAADAGIESKDREEEKKKKKNEKKKNPQEGGGGGGEGTSNNEVNFRDKHIIGKSEKLYQ